MTRIITILLLSILISGCAGSTKSYTVKRNLMLLDQTELPANAKFRSKSYQKKLHKNVKSNARSNKKKYKSKRR